MTTAVSLSGPVAVASPRAGERGGKGEHPKGEQSFEALAGRKGGMPPSGQAADQSPGDRGLRLRDLSDSVRMELQTAFGDWRLGGRAQMPDGTETQEVPDERVLFLAMPKGPDEASGPVATIDAEAAGTGDAEAADAQTDERRTPAAVEREQPAPARPGTTISQEMRGQGVATPPEQAAARSKGPAAAAADPAAMADDDEQSAQRSTGRPEPVQAAQSSRATAPAPRDVPRASAQPAAAVSAPADGPDGPQRPEGTVTPKGGQPGTATQSGMAKEAATPANDALAGRVSVIGANNAPAPAPSPVQVLGPTSAGLVSAMAESPEWRAATSEAAAPQQGRPGGPAGVQSLRIQLHPIELGMVTARLTQSGTQMAIEIQVESNDARQRLANDSEQIVRALKAVGIEVEKVTIQQAPQQASTNAAQQQAGYRDFSSQQQPSTESGSKGQGGQGSAGGERDDTRNASGEKAPDRAGGGVYI